jgi:hypothetical protein
VAVGRFTLFSFVGAKRRKTGPCIILPCEFAS